MSRLRKILPVALVVLAPAAMLYPLWANPLSAGEDDLVTYYPLRKFVGAALRDGRWPLENNLEATGKPLMAAPQSAVMFPLTWLFAVLPPRTAYALSIFATFSLAGLGAYLYLRRLGLVRAAATFGALAFQFSGFMVGHRVHLSMIQTAAFLPWGLWAIEDLGPRPGRAFVKLVPVGFLAVAAGHWGILAYMALAWAAYLLLRARPLGRAVAVACGAAVVAAAVAAPQLHATLALFGRSTRTGIGYAAAGENSFFPAAGVLAFFPFLMGCRTPNFFSRGWWGPWHLCEMLGYIGLVTLVLAAGGAWRLYRKRPAGGGESGSGPEAELRVVRPVRMWVWIGAAAAVWMFGYYLPTFRLIYLLPVVGKARCPARMLLVVDMALAALAALAVHWLLCAAGERAERLRRTLRRLVTCVLPLAMLAALLLVAVGAMVWRISRSAGAQALAFFGGTPDDAIRSLRPWNPAVLVPLGLAAATILAVRWWLAAPRRRAWILMCLLVMDLFTIARFVDIPAGQPPNDCETSPAAEWLNEPRNAPAIDTYRVYGLGRSYCDRPTELLLPRAGNAMGFATISSYGTWQSPAHAHLFGFDRYGHNADWRWLIRRNHLLSLYGVRYVLAAEGEFRRVIESVRVQSPAPGGQKVALGGWTLDNAERLDDGLRLVTPLMWWSSQARTNVSLRPEKVYTLRFEARGPDGGAAAYLSFWLSGDLGGGRRFGGEDLCGIVGRHRIAPGWRRFEWTFRTPAEVPWEVTLGLKTLSERPIEVRKIELEESAPPLPINIGGKLESGRRVYRKVAELPALNAGDGPVCIYENLLWRPVAAPRLPGTNAETERLRWPDEQMVAQMLDGQAPLLPDVAIRADAATPAVFRCVTLPAAGAFAGLVAAGWAWRRRRTRRRRP